LQPTSDDDWSAWWERYSRRTEIRFRSTEDRLDETRAQLDHVRRQISGQIRQARLDAARLVLLGLLGSLVITGLMCLGTIILLL
jgi:hypothetical protein